MLFVAFFTARAITTKGTKTQNGKNVPVERWMVLQFGESMNRDDQRIRDLCNRVRQTAFELHNHLRSGHLEKVYENGMAHRLRKSGLSVEQQKPLSVRDKDGTLLGSFFADLFVENCLVIELKATRSLAPEHIAQTLGYLRASGFRDAMVINFGASKLQVRKIIL